MDYTQFAGERAKITTIDNQVYEGLVWGFLFEDENESVVLEVWTEDYTFKVADIVSIERCDE